GPVAGLGSVNGDSLTAAYLTGAKSIPVPEKRRKAKQWLRVQGARQHNLKGIDVKIPLGVFCAVSGVSGSGKSTLVHKVLYENMIRLKGERTEEEPGRVKAIVGADDVGRVVMVDQSPLSRTPRSTPAVYTGAFDLIRRLFSETEDAKAQGMLPGFFSFNSGAGRCERCWGTGYEKVEMQFLSDLYVVCPECEGKRYQAAAMTVKLGGKSICDVLEMTTSEAIGFFAEMEGKTAARVVSALRLVDDVGMGYLRLGQPLNTLSGGESQRLKLVGHLLEANGKTNKSPSQSRSRDLLIFDEPTTGLHFDDVRMLLAVFERLVAEGNSILVIEHNLEVLKSADYLIDLGPEAGSDGGEVVVCGTPEEVAECEESHTGAALAQSLSVERYSLMERGNGALRVAEESAGEEDDGAIRVYGAREHNLKDIDVAIPRDELVVVTGLSGSGKSTLAFDILFGEGQRRFLDSMSPYARQFAEQLEKADIDHVTGLPPTVAIEQRVTRGGGKSTVATVTEVYHFLRLLFAKLGTQFCPECEVAVEKQSVSAIVEAVRQAAAKAGKSGVKLQAPLIKARKGFHTEVARWAGSKGYEELWVDGKYRAVGGFEKLERFKEHSIDVVIATVRKGDAVTEVREWVEQALRHGKGTARLAGTGEGFTVLSSEMSCPGCGRAFEELDPRLFSYNSPHGWCEDCRGYGQVRRTPKWFSDKDSDSMLEAEVKEEMRMERADAEELVECPSCAGARINEVARAVEVQGIRIGELAALSVREAAKVVASLGFKGAQKVIARDILREIAQRLRFMEEVGLGYLTLDRSAKTLSGGESQRIRLAAQLGSNLRGVLYVLDEPTIGLHPRDNRALLDTLTSLRDQGNSLLVVEHDEDTMRESDRIIDLGPGAGSLGGEVVAQGTWAQIQRQKGSVTGQYLKDPMRHPMRGERRKVPGKRAKAGWLRVKSASANNLKGIDVDIPLGCLTVICGISGSGKSSLMRGVIEPGVKAELKAKGRGKSTGKKTWKTMSGVGEIEAVYEVDQSPIGKTSRSTPATYVKVFDDIRKLFAQVPTARMRGYTASRFSFNTEGGRCESCEGNGEIKLEMTFMPTSYVPCEDCHGMRYNEPTLEVEYNGKNIGEVMKMTIGEAATFFESNPKISRTLGLMKDTGLGYLTLGQPSPTLSGGEAQRIKLVTELTRGIGRSQNARIRQNRKPKGNLYLIEEPSIGLHMADVRKLLEVLQRLVDEGNTVVVIEHNLDIIAEADWVLEIGPEAGEEGGEVVVTGSVEDVVRCEESRTAEFLGPLVGVGGES
ncbi:MAG: excinuclease ABC subunit A, partial [Verrucomicrobiota bacterium]